MASKNDNIKKYADFNHKVAPYGGPEEYCEKLVAEERERQKQEDQETLIKAIKWTIAIAGTFGAIINEVRHKWKDNRAKRNAELAEASQRSKEMLLQTLNDNNEALDEDETHEEAELLENDDMIN